MKKKLLALIAAFALSVTAVLPANAAATGNVRYDSPTIMDTKEAVNIVINNVSMPSGRVTVSGLPGASLSSLEGDELKDLMENGVQQAVKEFVKASKQGMTEKTGKAGVESLKVITYFKLSADKPGDATFQLPKDDGYKDAMTGDCYAIVILYTGNPADADGVTVQYCKISQAGRVTAHFDSLGPVALIVTSCTSAQALVNTYSNSVGSDAPTNNATVENAASNLVDQASVMADSEVKVPAGSQVAFSGGIKPISDQNVISTLKVALLNIMKQISVNGVTQVKKFDLPATGSGEIGMFVGSTFAGRIVIVLHYKNGAWEAQQKKVDAEGYIYPHFDSFSPVSLVITDRTEEIANLALTDSSTTGASSTGSSGSSSSSGNSSSSGSSSSSGGSSSADRTIQIGTNGTGAASVTSITPSITDSGKVLPAGAKMTTAVLTSGNEYARAAAQIAALLQQGNQCVLTDISLADANGAALHELGGYVAVTMALPFVPRAGNTIAVYRVAEDGTNIPCETAISGNQLTFKTNHFSTYAFIEVPAVNSASSEGAAGKLSASPKTADSSAALFLAFAAMAAATAIVVTRKKDL